MPRPLKNHSHEQFAQHLATGLDKGEAYSRVYPGANKGSAHSAGTRLFKIVKERVVELQKATETSNTLTMIERREFLARVVRADLNALDLEKDGDLLQEKITTTTPDGKEIVKVKLPGKRECVMSDAELSGELISKVEHSGEINTNVTILTEEKRASLVQKKRACLDRRLKAKSLNGSGHN